MESNGHKPDLPIKYPSITIPGKGTFQVKYDLAASYTLEDELGMDQQAFAAKLQEWIPRKVRDEETGEETEIAGKVSMPFLFKVLSACIWEQAKLTPREIAAAFKTWDKLPEIAMIVAEAFSKTQWSSAPPQEATTAQGTMLAN